MLADYQSYLDLVSNSAPQVPVVVEPYSLDAIASLGDAYIDSRPAILTGDKLRIEALLDRHCLSDRLIRIVDCASRADSVRAAASLVRTGEADYVVKGSLPTSDLLKGLLGRDQLGMGRVASHLYLIDTPTFPGRAIAFADAGVNIAPTLEAKADILRSSIEALTLLGVRRPLVAALSAVEVVKTSIGSTIDAAVLSSMSARGQFGAAVVDGPLSLDAALSKQAAASKSLTGEVPGHADLLLAPEITAANMTSKALIGACGRAMGVVLGCSAPIALPSRGDSRETRVHSLLLASYLAQHNKQGE